MTFDDVILRLQSLSPLSKDGFISWAIGWIATDVTAERLAEYLEEAKILKEAN